MFSSFVQITALQQQFVIFSASTIAPGKSGDKNVQ